MEGFSASYLSSVLSLVSRVSFLTPRDVMTLKKRYRNGIQLVQVDLSSFYKINTLEGSWEYRPDRFVNWNLAFVFVIREKCNKYIQEL